MARKPVALCSQSKEVTIMDLDNSDNGAFDERFVEETATSFMQKLALHTCRRDFSISSVDLQRIDEAEIAVGEQVRSYFEIIRRVVRERRLNLVRFGDIELVSLGEDCLSRTIPTQWGLKKCAKLGEKTHPFDLAVHPLPKVVHLIASDFADYLNTNDLVYIAERNLCRNTQLNITFNHEIGPQYAENGFALLRETYQRRVENFRSMLQTGRAMVFVVHPIRRRPNLAYHLKELYRVISHRRPAARFLIVCMRTRDPGDQPEPSIDSKLDGLPIRVIDAVHPHDGYIWYKVPHCLAPDGVAFEREMMCRLAAMIDSWR
jgi:hypothetical protein